MAKKTSKMLENLIQEASDPETDPERLRELTQLKYYQVERILWKNPNLPEEVWRKALLNGSPEAWSNPMAPFYLLSWIPSKYDWQTLEEAAKSATGSLWMEPGRCSVEGKQLLAAKVMEWWTTSESGVDMMDFLGRWACVRGIGSKNGKNVMRILVKCIKTTPNLTPKDLDLLHSFEQWSKGLQKNIPKCDEWSQAYHPHIISVCKYIESRHNAMRFITSQLLDTVAYGKSKNRNSAAYQEAKADHDRLLADLIRQEMTIPPTAE